MLDNIFIKSILATFIYIGFKTISIYLFKNEIKKIDMLDVIFLPLFFIIIFKFFIH